MVIIGSKVLFTYEQVNLTRKSEVLSSYEDILRLFRYNNRILERDLNRLTTKSKKYITLNRQNILDTVQRQWVRTGKYSVGDKKETHCELCNQPIIYLFEIKNRINKESLYVGSECIKKFPILERSSKENISIDELKKSIVQQEKYNKKNIEFNDMYPNVNKLLDENTKKLELTEYILPKEIDSNYQSTLKEIRKYRDNYIKGKIDTINKIVLNDRLYNLNELEKQRTAFVSEALNNKFAVKKSIFTNIDKSYRDNLINRIQDDGGTVTKDTIQYMWMQSFVESIINYFMFKLKNISLIKVENSKILWSIVTPYNIKYIIECNTNKFMMKFGRKIFSNEIIIDDDILSICTFYKNDENIHELFHQLNLIVRGRDSKYIFEYDLSYNIVICFDSIRRKIAKANLDTFLAILYNLILKDVNVVYNNISQIANKYTKWYSEKELRDLENNHVADILKELIKEIKYSNVDELV